MLVGSLFAGLWFGWFVMIHHLDMRMAEDEIEMPLQEPYHSWVEISSGLYWILGISFIIIAILGIALEEKLKINEKLILLPYSLLIGQIGCALLIHYFIALVKLQALGWAYLFFITLSLFMITSTIFLFGLTKMLYAFCLISFILLELLLTTGIIVALPTSGLYLETGKAGNLLSNFGTKIMVWVLSTIGLFLYMLPWFIAEKNIHKS
ncbi:hypothetical protein [Mesobacillus foraminis]|uniref:Uncharacterized protein n=1 Tax=Mesobacillus foraminis TaxID=279826 RepID=A0A4R2BJE4_9BACI|nr:hypothetical protein [Mesobacillus foraminis]TCN27086.1 hypothetical protein EV146_10227 [Mesobacillus foraminis]